MDKKFIAFTLIELLVVIAIIGILSGLIVVTMSGVTTKATIAKSQVFSNSLRNALMLNLISEWKFDGSGATDGQNPNSSYLQDTWGSANTLSTNGIVYVRSGSNCVSGSCLQVDSSYVYSNASNLNPGTGSLTVEGWVYPTDYTYPMTRFPVGNYAGSGTPCWAVDNGYSASGIRILFSDGTNRVDSFLTCDGGYTPLDTLNKWAHIAVSFDRTAGKAYAYINGVKQTNSVNISSATGNVTNPSFQIGNTAGWLLDGKMDSFRIYNSAVPSSVIKEQYYAGLNSLFLNGGLTKEEYQSRINDYASNN
jgi:prepilin-type N-terminal cleavage/methylation domain-containing protein